MGVHIRAQHVRRVCLGQKIHIAPEAAQQVQVQVEQDSSFVNLR